MTLNGRQVAMSRPCFAMLLLLASGVDAKEVHRRLLHAHKAPNVAACDWLASFQEGSLFTNESDIEDIYKTMSNLRGKLKKAGFADVELLVPQRGRAVMFPLSRIKFRNGQTCGDWNNGEAMTNIVSDTISKAHSDRHACKNQTTQMNNKFF